MRGYCHQSCYLLPTVGIIAIFDGYRQRRRSHSHHPKRNRLPLARHRWAGECEWVEHTPQSIWEVEALDQGLFPSPIHSTVKFPGASRTLCELHFILQNTMRLPLEFTEEEDDDPFN